MMSKEALRLALEALEYIYEGANNQGPHTGISWRCVSNKAEPAITALREALAKPDFREGYVPEPVKPAQQEFVSPGGGYVPAIPAQQALDKMAENARELGLDYESAQQEPFGYFKAEPFGWTDCAESDEGAVALYERPQPAQRTWVNATTWRGLTDEELSEVYNQADWDTVNGWEYERAIEAKLEEKNT